MSLTIPLMTTIGRRDFACSAVMDFADLTFRMAMSL